MNKITILGRLTADVEMKETTSGVAYCKFHLASRGKMRDKDGNYPTDFFLCTAWREKAELLAKYTKKGSQLMATGYMQSRQYEDEGKKNTIWEFNVEDFEFAGAGPTESNENIPPQQSVNLGRKKSPIDELPKLDDDEELPF